MLSDSITPIDPHRQQLNRIKGLENELKQCDDELEYQVGHKRIAELQARINDIEHEIEQILHNDADFLMSLYREGGRVFASVLKSRYGKYCMRVASYIVEKGYVREDEECLCPRCNRSIALLSDVKQDGLDEVLCDTCDKLIPASDYEEHYTRAVWIRTWNEP